MTNDDCRRLETFYSVLNQTLHSHREATRRLDHFLSTGFNVFRVIRPNENRLSEVIADLLDPSGSHGQRRKFLDAFLQVINRPDLKDKKLPKVGREVWTDHNSENPYRRIDIVVEFENKAFGLGIENKKPEPGTGDLQGQLEDYYHHLKNKYGENKFCLVYLTKDGSDPDEKSIECSLRERLKSENKLVCVSYSHGIREWIEECCRLCESDKFRWFLRDFMDYINGGQTMLMQNEKKIILKHALEKENLETALDINSAFNGKLHGQIIFDFLDELKKYVLETLGDPDEREWELDKDLVASPLDADKLFGFKKRAWNGQYAVVFAPQEKNGRNLRIGVWKQKDEPSQPSLKSKLDVEFSRNGNANNYWEWYHHLDETYRNWDEKEALIKLHNGEAVKVIGPYLVRIIEVIDAHVRGSE